MFSDNGRSSPAGRWTDARQNDFRVPIPVMRKFVDVDATENVPPLLLLLLSEDEAQATQPSCDELSLPTVKVHLLEAATPPNRTTRPQPAGGIADNFVNDLWSPLGVETSH